MGLSMCIFRLHHKGRRQSRKKTIFKKTLFFDPLNITNICLCWDFKEFTNQFGSFHSKYIVSIFLIPILFIQEDQLMFPKRRFKKINFNALH